MPLSPDHKANDTSTTERLFWLDFLRAVALLAILAIHITQEAFGFPFIANPQSDWPSLATRWAQLAPLPCVGWRDLIGNGIRYVGLFGDAAVGLFLFASGFGLTRSMLQRPATPSWGNFVFKRLRRIFPTWWSAHLLFLLLPAVLGWRVSIAHPEFYYSMIGLRSTTAQIYYGVPAWWFIGLLLQLYLFFPLIGTLVRKQRIKTLIGIGIGCLVIRGIGLLAFDSFVDTWNRGGIFVTRLPEFLGGVLFASYLHNRKEPLIPKFSLRLAVPAAIGFVLASGLGLTLSGMSVSPLLTSLTATLFLYVVSPLFDWSPIRTTVSLISKHSLSLFLVHEPIAFTLISKVDPPIGNAFLVQTGMFVLVTVILAIGLEQITNALGQSLRWMFAKWGMRRMAMGTGLAAASLLLPLTLAEIQMRKSDPQDVTDFGWSERRSLQPDANLGYRLKPNTTTRLRWETYDYTVHSNSHGFPGPDFDFAKSPGTYRIMALGDAFTSAEGVDTKDAWPRQLEEKLRDAGTQAEVVNFGVTGYGPNQYAWLVREYAPKLKPDAIVVAMFTNEFDDVHGTVRDFEEQIGFSRPDPDCLLGYVTGRHLTRWFRGKCLEPAFHRLTNRTSPRVGFYCQEHIFEKGNRDYLLKGQRLIRRRFDEIEEVANSIGAEVVVMAVPAPVQVATRGQLAYLPEHLDFSDTTRFDLNEPQRLIAELAQETHWAFVDLREPLLQVRDQRPYFSENLHWTKVGHECAAAVMADRLRNSRLTATADLNDTSVMGRSAIERSSSTGLGQR